MLSDYLEYLLVHLSRQRLFEDLKIYTAEETEARSEVMYDAGPSSWCLKDKSWTQTPWWPKSEQKIEQSSTGKTFELASSLAAHNPLIKHGNSTGPQTIFPGPPKLLNLMCFNFGTILPKRNQQESISWKAETAWKCQRKWNHLFFFPAFPQVVFCFSVHCATGQGELHQQPLLWGGNHDPDVRDRHPARLCQGAGWVLSAAACFFVCKTFQIWIQDLWHPFLLIRFCLFPLSMLDFTTWDKFLSFSGRPCGAFWKRNRLNCLTVYPP